MTWTGQIGRGFGNWSASWSGHSASPASSASNLLIALKSPSGRIDAARSDYRVRIAPPTQSRIATIKNKNRVPTTAPARRYSVPVSSFRELRDVSDGAIWCLTTLSSRCPRPRVHRVAPCRASSRSEPSRAQARRYCGIARAAITGGQLRRAAPLKRARRFPRLPFVGCKFPRVRWLRCFFALFPWTIACAAIKRLNRPVAFDDPFSADQSCLATILTGGSIRHRSVWLCGSERIGLSQPWAVTVLTCEAV